MATWIDPAVRLDGKEQRRVSGRVTYSSEKIDGLRTLRITTNVIGVYTFEGGGDTPIAASHDEIQWEFPRPGHVDRGNGVLHGVDGLCRLREGPAAAGHRHVGAGTGHQ
ncbi:hypothetical protein [Actinoplanes flavus]|uniref:Uncharacterized protein n=1 Tax=Actinoplanes flavus TaxID=2820290 RepID=A0ABS3UYM7_9ACTN|nr:hypothetical protein [Actinoplanes flavus]MBO3743673.1 hypothetical protein [Actinoplanes flavus]